MINRINLVGRLTRDWDMRFTPSGIAVANGGIAVNRPFKNQHGENEADFFNCVVWRKQAENAAQYTGKGSLVAIDGRLQSRRYENREGRNVTVIEVVAESVQFLDQRQQGQKKESNQSNDVADNLYGGGESIDISDEDLPF